MIDLEKLANLINERGLMQQSFQTMTKEDILYMCKSVIRCQQPEYITLDPELICCYKYNWWVVYRDSACVKCNDKEICPACPTE